MGYSMLNYVFGSPKNGLNITEMSLCLCILQHLNFACGFLAFPSIPIYKEADSFHVVLRWLWRHNSSHFLSLLLTTDSKTELIV